MPSSSVNVRLLSTAAALPKRRAPRNGVLTCRASSLSRPNSDSTRACAVRDRAAVQGQVPCVLPSDLADAEEFAERFVKSRKPAILRGACRSWLPLVDRHWSEQRLLARCGDNRVTLNFTRGDARFGKTSLRAVEFAAERDTTLRCAWKELFTPEADGIIGASKASYLFSGSDASHASDKGATLSDDLLSCLDPVLPKGLAHLRQPFVDESIAGPADARGVQPPGAKTLVWLSKGGTTACTHRDTNWNFHAVLRGTKRFLLAEPGSFHHLYDKRRIGLRLQETDDYGGVADEGVLIEDPPGFTKVFEGFSPVSLEAPDLDRFPLAEAVTVHEAVCNEGDVLFMPPGWWHEVHSTPGAGGQSLTFNYWADTCFGIPSRDEEVEARRRRYLDALQLQEPDLMPAWMDAY